MSEKSKITGVSLTSRRSGYLAWFVILWAATFVLVLGLFLLQNETLPLGTLIGATVASSAAFSAILVGGVFFCRWVCHWRNFRRFLFGLACLGTLIALAYAEENWRGKRAWLSHRAHWEAQGDKFEITALAPPPVPDEKNLALGTLLKPAMDFTVGPTGLVWRDTNALARLQKFSNVFVPGNGRDEKQTMGSLEKGSFADLSSWRQYYRSHTNYPPAAVSASDGEAVLSAMSRFAPELTQLHADAAARPDTRFPIQYDREPNAGILLPHLAYLNAIAIVLNIRATAELEVGRSNNAFADLMLCFRLTDGIATEPLAIDQFSRIKLLDDGLQTLREGMVRRAWNESQLITVQNYLGSLNLLAELKLALKGEMALELDAINYLRREGLISQTMDFFDLRASPWLPLYQAMPGGWYYRNMIVVSDVFHKYIFPSVDENALRVFPEIHRQGIDAMTEMSVSGRVDNILARWLLPTFPITKSARMQMYVAEARVACALERCRSVKGRLPDTLAPLVPEFIDRIPADVMDGKPLRYRLEADGSYVLYSIGWNQVDDGGKVAFTSDKPAASVEITKGDWVWSMPAPK